MKASGAAKGERHGIYFSSDFAGDYLCLRFDPRAEAI
jgi:hypothetical protein